MFMLIVLVACLSSQTFWYFEKRVYCDIENQNITIFLKKWEWLVKCQTYMDTIYQMAVKKYGEISAIRSYINQWDDVYYRKWILEDKKSEFIQLVNYRTQIKTAVDKFESALFEKYYTLLQEPMQKYYSDLETQYYIMINQDVSLRPFNYSIKIEQLGQQMWNVSRVLNAKKLDDIMDVMSSYIYLKQQLRWI